MKNMFGISVMLMFSGLFYFSCSKNEPAADEVVAVPEDDEEKPEEEENDDEEKTYVYGFNREELVKLKLYVGSKNGGIDKSAAVTDPKSFFKNYFDDGNKIDGARYDSLKVYKDTLVEFPTTYAGNTFQYKVSTMDSLFRVVGNGTQFYGFKLPDSKGIAYDRAFYRFVKVRETSGVGLDGKQEGFLSDGSFFSDNPARFAALADMTEETDTVLYCNVRYYYQ
ncbi:hypothetical protein [Sphingobacterium sp. LRF_L2]|uniref:hypothetical protein n=1 Tax=Sphingobacterium sp. LRF_L2 TaxID=3369421 RepID=UPI003F63E8BD